MPFDWHTSDLITADEITLQEKVVQTYILLWGVELIKSIYNYNFTALS